ncbi:hypothetical protein PC39_15769 [Salinisphaera sp. PC39]|uniref:DUF488 domain-containing protein n=1 Tax=Salinisphaera sp. PC39 TaxID=1304156 RepID=UPI00333E58B4
MTADTRVLTVGHSNRDGADFVALLRRHGIGLVADVRTVPRSRRHPQFNRDNLAASLEDAGIGYRHFKPLGGWRKPRPDSENEGLTSEGFRGYADHMDTPAFGRSVEALIAAARERTVAVMCAEANPANCHRSLLADALTVRGIAVAHIVDADSPRPHILTPWAETRGTRLIYPFALHP